MSIKRECELIAIVAVDGLDATATNRRCRVFMQRGVGRLRCKRQIVVVVGPLVQPVVIRNRPHRET